MEYWDKYCGISKNARSLLAELDPPVLEQVPKEISKDLSHTEVVLSQINEFGLNIDKAYHESLKFHDVIKDLNASKEGIVTSSKKLNKHCSKLMKDRDYLVALNSSIQSKYFYYMHLESLEGQIILLTRDPISMKKRFLEIFAQLEDAIDFFTQNPNYKDSAFYQTEYETLMDTWASSLITSLSESFQYFYTYYENYFKTITNSDDICKIFKQLIITPGKYCDSGYIMSAISSSYFKIRTKHVKNVLSEVLVQMREKAFVLNQCEIACKVVSRYWKKENKLFCYYFSEGFGLGGLNDFFLAYTDPVYEQIREDLLQETDLDSLCQVSLLLQTSAEQSKLLIFSKLYEDVQERITYSVTLYINEEIVPGLTHELIHPAVVKTVELLKMLQFKINTEIFDSITGETVAVCLTALSQSLSQEDFIEAHTFLIRNILYLRREIDSFGIQVKNFNNKRLDFTDTKRLFWKLVMGDVSLHKQGVFAELVHSGVPKYSENNDKDIENEFRNACQSYILRVFHEIANPILVFIMRTKEVNEIPYEEAAKILMESSNRITNIFPRFQMSLQAILDEKNYGEMTSSVSTQILKAFRQLIAYMEQHYISQPLPLLTDIEALFQD